MEQEEDQLSILPITILHNVLSKLPKKDVARTSVLSKAWLEISYTFPILSFSETKITRAVPQPVDGLPRKNKDDFIEYVKSTLLRFRDQRLAIKEFKLSVDCFELGYMSRDVDLWLKLASESGVEVLKLCNKPVTDYEGLDDRYVLPKSVVEAKSLTKLVLKGKIRVDQAFMNHSIKLFSLRELNLVFVHLKDEQAIENLISYCPLIEIITLKLFGGMKSLSMRGLQKLKTVNLVGIKEIYIDEAPNIQSLYYSNSYFLNTPFKVDSIRCKNLKELSLIGSTILTDKWFLELFKKFPFLETLYLYKFKLPEKINISSVQLKELKFYRCSNLKEANIDAPNLSFITFNHNYVQSKPIISFLRISSQLVVLVEIRVKYLDVCYMRELLQNIKHQNVVIVVYPFIPMTNVDATNPMFLDLSSPPPRIKYMHLLPIDEDETFILDISVLVDYLLLYCVPEAISFDFDTSNRALIECLYEKLMRRKDEDCFCNSSNTKCWWHNLKDVKVISSMKIHKNADFKTILESLPTFAPDDYIRFMLEF